MFFQVEAALPEAAAADDRPQEEKNSTGDEKDNSETPPATAAKRAGNKVYQASWGSQVQQKMFIECLVTLVAMNCCDLTPFLYKYR